MQKQRLLSVVLLAFFAVILCCNFTGTLSENVQIHLSDAVVEGKDHSSSSLSIGDDKKYMNLYSLLGLILATIVVVNNFTTFIPEWYYKLKKLNLTPIHFGSNFRILSSLLPQRT